MSNVVIIWPCYPYRWGIAHHTNRLADTLIKLWHRVRIFTFSLQYPRFLYPGNHQFEPLWTPSPLPESSDLFVKESISTINPFSWYRTARAIVEKNPDFCILRYWHPYFIPCFTFIAWMLRRQNIPVICIIDNLFPHERHFWDTFLIRFFFTQITRAITQSEVVHKQFHAFFPHIPEMMIPHPVYDQFWPVVWQEEARQRLKIPTDRKVLLFFWFIRPYKGLDILLSIMPQLIARYPNIHLIIAGECFGSFKMYQKIIDTFDLSKYITLHIKYIQNTDIPIYFGACDLLVMPYRSMTNSGIENIGHNYAPRILITVWIGECTLFDKVQKSIDHQQVLQKKIVSWNEYISRMLFFIDSSSL